VSYIQPVIRHMLLCDDVVFPNNKLSIINLLHKTGPAPGGHYPFVLPRLCVYVTMTGGRGKAIIKVEARHSRSGKGAFTSPSYSVQFPTDPLQVGGLTIRLLNVRFTDPGLYWVELWVNGAIINKEPLILR
jgi:hypothetical protein